MYERRYGHDWQEVSEEEMRSALSQSYVDVDAVVRMIDNGVEAHAGDAVFRRKRDTSAPDAVPQLQPQRLRVHAGFGAALEALSPRTQSWYHTRWVEGPAAHHAGGAR